MSSIEHDSIPVTAAPGVTKEVEEAIRALESACINFGEFDDPDFSYEKAMWAANALLLAAIEKYGQQQRKEGWDDCLADEFEERSERRKQDEDWL